MAPGRLALLCVALLGFPVFLMVSPSGGVSLPVGSSVADRAGLLSVPMSVGLCGLVFLTTRPLHRKLDIVGNCLLIFCAVNMVAFLVGAQINGVSGLSMAFLAQTFLPMIGYVAARRISQYPVDWISRALRPMAWVPLLSLVAIAVTTLAHGGRPWVDESLGPLAVPQARRYLPTVLAFALILFCRAEIARRLTLVRLGLAGGSIILLAASHSRTGLVILAAGFAVFVLFDMRLRSSGRINSMLLAAAAVVMMWFALSTVDLSNAPEAVSRLSGSDTAAQVSTDRRESALKDSVYESFTTPLGRMYKPSEAVTLGGVRADYARVSNSENQIGEYGLRAGPVALISLGVAIGTILLRSRRVLAASAVARPEFEGLWLATAATVGVTAFTQQALSQPYTGIVLWFGLGMLASLPERLEGAARTESANA